jgi:hypothetical protein
LFEAITALFRKDADKRNALAHGVYGHTEELPDALLIADARDMQKHWLNMFVKQHLEPPSSEFVAKASRTFYSR